MDKSQFRELIDAHLEAPEPECRWCFAIDRVRVKGEIIAQCSFSDALLLHLKCPRCGGEFTFYSEGVDDEILKGLIFRLHPELEGRLGEERFNGILRLLFPEHCEVN